MSEIQTAIYMGIVFLYCFFYYVAMKERKEDGVHNFLSVVIFILALASIVFPLYFDKLWKLVALVSVSMIVATVFTDDSGSNTASNHDALWFFGLFEAFFYKLYCNQTLHITGHVCSAFQNVFSNETQTVKLLKFFVISVYSVVPVSLFRSALVVTHILFHSYQNSQPIVTQSSLLYSEYACI